MNWSTTKPPETSAPRAEDHASRYDSPFTIPLVHSAGFSVRRRPFLYITASLVAGILIDKAVGPPRLILLVLAVSCLGASLKFVAQRRDGAATAALLVAFAINGALLSLGERANMAGSRLARLFDNQTILPGEAVELTGVLMYPPEPGPDARYLDVEAESVRARGQEVPASGCARTIIMLRSPKAVDEFRQLNLDYGSRIRVRVALERARRFSNPGSPDFNEYLERHGYDLRGTIKSPLLIESLGRASVNPLLDLLYGVRLRLMNAIDGVFRPPVAGTLKAMLAGNRYFVDPAIAERLRASATYHTLVIAGLHIGIIAWVLLGGGLGLKRRRRISVIAALAVLWGYAVMVGLGPPVTRATLMITVGLVGPLLFRQAASINTVALAAFSMLALKPALVADPGFQLSFAAVTGIVALALPLAEKLQGVANWRPASHTPHPPDCSRPIRVLAETLFWDQEAFESEMRGAPIRFQLRKARAAALLSRLRIQWLPRSILLLVITSTAIQLTTLPLMVVYFNRVAPVGVLLNIFAGLLTALIMLAGLAALTANVFSAWVAAKLTLIVNAGHWLLAQAIVPFYSIPGATFRAAHYDDWHRIVYALYFIPLGVIAVLLERWRPVAERKESEQGSGGAEEQGRRDTEEQIPRSSAPQLPSSSAPLPRSLAGPILVAVLLMLAVVAVIKPIPASSSGRLTIHFLDVGQGDSALVVFPHGATMLVDGGGELFLDKRPSGNGVNDASTEATPDAGYDTPEGDPDETHLIDRSFSIGEAVVSRFIWSQGRTRIDYALATHAHADHIGGLCDVVRNITVSQGVVGHAPAGDREFDFFAKAVEQNGVQVAAVARGDRFELEGVRVEVLWPRAASGPAVTSGNDDSVVLRLTFGSVSILLAGDIEQSAESALVDSFDDLRADVLKVPHHGSRTSSTGPFLDRVRPALAVISVGERSRFGHPHKDVVERYLARGVKLFQTGRDGMVTVETDGSRLNAVTYRDGRKYSVMR